MKRWSKSRISHDEYNQKLSEGQAQSGADCAVAEGVPQDRIKQVVGYGKTKPMVSNDSRENRAKTRRVEVTVCE